MNVGDPRCWNGGHIKEEEEDGRHKVAGSCWSQAAKDRGVWRSFQDMKSVDKNTIATAFNDTNATI